MPQKGRLRSFTRGSDYRDLTGKILVFLDRWAFEVVAYERWSYMEVWLYFLAD